MLRLKGERDDMLREVEDGDPREPVPADELTAADAFAGAPGDFKEQQYWEGEEYGLEEPPSTLPLRAVAIAAATFVPTFLAVFFGLPYLLGSATPVRAPGTPSPSPPVAVATPPGSELSPDVTASLSETLRGGSPSATAPRVFDEPAPHDASDGSARVEPATPRAPEPAPVAPTPEPAAPPALPPAGPRSVSAPRPTAEAARPGGWAPAAAFADREAAGRLASSIQKQGYPVEVRQDGSSSRPWVVWIGAQPSGARRR
jgi:hypothetical protein